MLSLYRKILGHPFVYDHVRPRVVGGIDLSPVYDALRAESRRVILDVGCGTGDALRHIDGFERYVGLDTDPAAIATAKRRHADRANVSFACGLLDDALVESLAPTAVILAGVLHHLSNDDAHAVLGLARRSPRLQQVSTGDITFLPGHLVNNVFAMMDRGRFCRDPDAYAQLARRAGLDVERAGLHDVSPTNDRMRYYAMSLRPRVES